MHLARGVTVVACTAAVLCSAVACKSSDTDGDPGRTTLVSLYGADGNMSNSFGEEFTDKPGILDGMKGTTPLTPLSDDFKRRLHEIDPKLNDYTYAAESYDAVVITALAAQLAGTVAPRTLAKYINGVTTGGEECDTVKQCLALARSGADLAYRGISLRRGGFTDVGEPSTASYATLHFDVNDQLDDGKTEFVGAGDASTTTKAPAPPPKSTEGRRRSETGAPLKLGGLLPKTGDLALMYPPLIAGVRLALAEVNAAGGVLGEPVEWLDGDDGTDPAVAEKTVQQHIADGVQVIIGAAASGISRAVLPDVVKAGRILFSPSNTAADLTEADDKGLYFRTAPSDLLQGKALADVMMRDSVQRVAIVARADAYGEGLQHNVADSLQRAGLPADQIKLLTYEPAEGDARPDVSEAVRQVKDFNPDAVLIIGYGESAEVIKGLVAAGVQIRH
ncbi:MAG: ABC transporter substrate-binding protein [Micromonosporaceae bacterium]|jgi:ABC-type branched-subunit amino acid transport system substrate-binding protein|nr:ABC transporter substrate-binding protein [Micromonosporaceae bacterium]